jgi:toxin ParE1/3/4
VTVRFTPSARAQSLAAVASIRRDNPPAAAQLRRQAERVLRRLQRFPNSGRVIPEFPELPYREVVITPWQTFQQWCPGMQSEEVEVKEAA